MELEPAAVLFHLISISGEKQREREGGGGKEMEEEQERDFNPLAPSRHTCGGLEKILSKNWNKKNFGNIQPDI